MNRIPFKEKFVEKIRNREKTTTIRTLKYRYRIGEDYFVGNSDVKIKILNLRPINIPEDITKKIIKTEGFKDKEEMLRFFHRYKLPQTMYFYTFEMIK